MRYSVQTYSIHGEWTIMGSTDMETLATMIANRLRTVRPTRIVDTIDGHVTTF